MHKSAVHTFRVTFVGDPVVSTGWCLRDECPSKKKCWWLFKEANG